MRIIADEIEIALLLAQSRQIYAFFPREISNTFLIKYLYSLLILNIWRWEKKSPIS